VCCSEETIDISPNLLTSFDFHAELSPRSPSNSRWSKKQPDDNLPKEPLGDAAPKLGGSKEAAPNQAPDTNKQLGDPSNKIPDTAFGEQPPVEIQGAGENVAEAGKKVDSPDPQLKVPEVEGPQEGEEKWGDPVTPPPTPPVHNGDPPAKAEGNGLKNPSGRREDAAIAKDPRGDKGEGGKAAKEKPGATLAERCAATVVALEAAKRELEGLAGEVGGGGSPAWPRCRRSWKVLRRW
jgi:hypothetical protein